VDWAPASKLERAECIGVFLSDPMSSNIQHFCDQTAPTRRETLIGPKIGASELAGLAEGGFAAGSGAPKRGRVERGDRPA